jgi:hypothetical protein
MCFLQQLWGNVVFGAKKSITCGLVQKSHQHVVLPAISSRTFVINSWHMGGRTIERSELTQRNGTFHSYLGYYQRGVALANCRPASDRIGLVITGN